MSISSVRSGLAVVVVAVALMTACGGSNAPAEQAQPAAQAANTAPAAPAAASAPEPQTVADIFPAGEGRDLVLNNCASCHNVACSAIGQRNPDSWNALKNGHKDRVPDNDLEKIFAYLNANFNNTKPEPKIPPKLLEGGCTPF